MKTEGLHIVRPRAAGLDVHKMEITATVRLCEGEGEPVMETRCFSTLPSGLDEMVAWLSDHGVEAAVMEGTGVYWQAPFAALEAAGIEAILVHARQVKQLKGRKTDVGDSVWLACVCQFGLCTPSHFPPEPFRQLRALSRQRRVLVRQRSTARNRVQKIIDRAGVRIGGILSDVFGVNGRKILDGLAEGTAREVILASLTSHVANKLEGLGEALTLSLGDNDRFMLDDLLGLLHEEDRRADDAVGGAAPPADHHPRHRPHRRLDHPDRDRPRHRGVRLQAALRRLGRALPRQQRERRKAPQRSHPHGFQNPARRPRRVRTRRGSNQGLPVRGPPSRPRRPARPQARHRSALPGPTGALLSLGAVAWIDESTLTKGQRRNLGALRKSVGDEIGEQAFAE